MKQTKQSSPDKQKTDPMKLLQYLDDFGKQISIRKTNNSSLEEQLSSLSKAYNQAQEKLLQTETALMAETVLVEKQRSIIDIYKYVLKEDMEEDGILSFVQHLETDETRNQIFQELQELKIILSKKKLKQGRRSINEDKSIESIKKQLLRMQQQKQASLDQTEIAINENYDLKMQMRQLKQQKQSMQTEFINQKAKNGQLTMRIESTKMQNQKITDQLRTSQIQCEQMKLKIRQLSIFQTKYTQIIEIFNQKLNLLSQNKKQNTNLPNKTQKISQKETRKVTESSNIVQQIRNKLAHLLKYKNQYKKLKLNIQDYDFIRKQICLMKLFLSQEALILVQEYQQKRLECLESELRNLAVLEKTRLLKLQQSGRDVWKYKIQLMKENQFSNDNKYMIFANRSQTLSSKDIAMLSSSQIGMISSKEGVNMIQSLRVLQQVQKNTTARYKMQTDISQFDS